MSAQCVCVCARVAPRLMHHVVSCCSHPSRILLSSLLPCQDRITDERLEWKVRSKTEVFSPSKLARCQRASWIVRHFHILQLTGPTLWKGCCLGNIRCKQVTGAVLSIDVKHGSKCWNAPWIGIGYTVYSILTVHVQASLPPKDTVGMFYNFFDC